jgi:hypothetical protein
MHWWAWLSAAMVMTAVRPVHAEPVRAELELGTELDSNVARVETGTAVSTEVVAAPLLRAGGKVHKKWTMGGSHTGQLAITAATRTSLDRAVVSEDTAAFSTDLRLSRRSREPDGAVGIHGQYYDALPLAADNSTRAFRSLLAEVFLVALSAEAHSVQVAAAARRVEYKPDRDFDWSGPSASIRVDAIVWRDRRDEATFELAVDYRFDHRAYTGLALANGCPAGASNQPMCFVPTELRRTDLHHVAAIEGTYSGDTIFAARYQVAINDSSSFGQSLVRHQLGASATRKLPWSLYATATIVAQLEQYLDGLVVARDVQSQSFVTLEDDNRSSLQLRLGRPLGRGLWAELRAAMWRNLGGPDDISFRRSLIYAGLMWRTRD